MPNPSELERDRAAFVEENSVAVVRDLEAMVGRQRQEITRLSQRVKVHALVEQRREKAEAEVARLRTALQLIADGSPSYDARLTARRALEGGRS
jgi:hypothetical protein